MTSTRRKPRKRVTWDASTRAGKPGLRECKECFGRGVHETWCKASE